MRHTRRFRAGLVDAVSDHGNVKMGTPRLMYERKSSTGDGCSNEPDAKLKVAQEDTNVGNKLKAKEVTIGKAESVDNGVQLQTFTDGDNFPKRWKYKGLAEIAEKEKATSDPAGATLQLGWQVCSRIDGGKWRCQLRCVEGFPLCEHHLQKAQAKKIRRTS